MEPSKRRRFQGACDNCRSKKRACDSAQRLGIACSNCHAFGIKCTHLAAKSRKNGSIPQNSEHWGVYEDIQAHLAAILSTTKPYVVPDSRVIRPLLTGLAQYARDLEAKVLSLEQTLRSLTTASELQTMEDPMSKLTLSENKNRHYGATDEVQFLNTAADIGGCLEPDPTESRRPEFWTTPLWQVIPVHALPPLNFPPPDLIDSLVDIFLKMFNVHISLLHGPSFKRDIAQGVHYTSREFGSVVLAVCTVSSRVSTDPRITPGHEAGWQWFQQLRPIDPTAFTAESSTSLWDLQLIAVMVICMHSMGFVHHLWLLLGWGIRLAQEMGIHRKRRKDAGMWTALDESLKRVWWSFVGVDIYAASMFGRVQTTNSDQFDVEYPLEVDDECWPGELLADPTRPWTQPAGVPSTVTAWVLHLKLLEILSFAHTTIYSLKRSELWDTISTAEWGHNVAVELDSALNKWIDAIPDYLRWDPHLPTETSACIYTSYYWVEIQIHRPFIRSGESRSFPSVAMCTNAARSCAHVVSVHQRSFGTLPVLNMFSGVLHSSIVLLLAVSDGKHATPRDLEDVYMMMDILKCHEEKWRVAGRLHDIIREIVFVLKVPAGLQSKNIRKRKEKEVDVILNVETIDWNMVLDWGGVGGYTNWGAWNMDDFGMF